ncbi:MAG: zinc ribbon domain-containing protein [Micropruina sp.]|uniref:zinc ribbon domain-containing protein n=1 Tax=Micropruina sp. TaxID=2737536 RepID=UPI0039E4D1CA
MIGIELICENCGATNRAGAEFCQNCKAFLAWDRSDSGLAAAQQAPPAPYTQPVTAQVPPTRPEPVPPASGQPGWARFCTWCGAGNPAGRHLCRRCGLLLDQGDPWSGPSGSPQPPGGAGSAVGGYERSVPGWYRWRGVLVGSAVAVLAVVVAVGAIAAPRIVQAWNTSQQSYRPVSAAVTVEPAGAVLKTSKAAALTDGTADGLTLSWAPQNTPTCDAPGTGWIVLTPAEPVRIVGILVYPGLDRENPQRDLEPQPTQLGVRFDDGPCQSVALDGADPWVTVAQDSQQPVGTVRIGVIGVGDQRDKKPQVSFTEIKLLTAVAR